MYSPLVEESNGGHLGGRMRKQKLIKYILIIRLFGLNLFRDRRDFVLMVMDLRAA